MTVLTTVIWNDVSHQVRSLRHYCYSILNTHHSEILTATPQCAMTSSHTRCFQCLISSAAEHLNSDTSSPFLQLPILSNKRSLILSKLEYHHKIPLRKMYLYILPVVYPRIPVSCTTLAKRNTFSSLPNGDFSAGTTNRLPSSQPRTLSSPSLPPSYKTPHESCTPYSTGKAGRNPHSPNTRQRHVPTIKSGKRVCSAVCNTPTKSPKIPNRGSARRDPTLRTRRRHAWIPGPGLSCSPPKGGKCSSSGREDRGIDPGRDGAKVR